MSTCTCWQGDPAKAPPCQCQPEAPDPQATAHYTTQRTYMLKRDQLEELVKAARPIAAQACGLGNAAGVMVPAAWIVALAESLPDIDL